MTLSPTPTNLELAADLIRSGRLVAFPTETVYGLGANALSETAVRRIFEAKKRPLTSPLIVHVSSAEMARGLVVEWPETAERLTARFWPGPLTLVLKKASCIPDAVTAGLPSVGVRMPAHPVALELIRRAGVPIAAPSANPFSRLSPTRAAHVSRFFPRGVDMILDGGPSKVGIESTVLSLVEGIPRLLRFGMIGKEDIETIVGQVACEASEAISAALPHSSPGQHLRHYSPRTPMFLWEPGQPTPPGRGICLTRVGREIQPGMKSAVRALSDHPKEYSAELYSLLHEIDDSKYDWIAVELPPDTPPWQAVRDRLIRGATFAYPPTDPIEED